ncbi:MAG: hypothetical protein ACO1OO_15845 [Flavisolibacter sp.]
MFGFDSNSGQEHVTELIERLKSNVNLSDEQAQKVMETIKNYVLEKYPMLSGAVENIFGK